MEISCFKTIKVLSFMISLLEHFVINLFSVTVLNKFLLMSENKHLTEQNSIFLCRKSSNHIAYLCPVRQYCTKQPTLCWCYIQSVCSCCFIRPSMFKTFRTKLESLWISLTSYVQLGDLAAHSKPDDGHTTVTH